MFKYIGVPVVVLGYHADRIFIRLYNGGAPFWVGAEYVT